MKHNPEESLRIWPFVFWQLPVSLGDGCRMSLLLFSGKMLAGKTAHASKTDSRNFKKPLETSDTYACVCVFKSINNHDSSSISAFIL